MLRLRDFIGALIVSVCIIMIAGCTKAEHGSKQVVSVVTPAVIDTIETEEPTATPEPTVVPTATPVVVRYDKKFSSDVKKALSKLTYVEVVQEQGSLYDNVNKRMVKLKYDCKNKVGKVHMNLTLADGLGKDTYEYVSDFKNEAYYTKKGKKWVEKNGSVSVYDLPYSKISNVYDLYSEIISIKKAEEGYKDSRGYTVFKSTKKATKKDLISTKGITLGNKEVTLKFKGYKPVAYKVIVRYKVNDVDCASYATVRFKNYGKNTLSLNKLVRQY